MSKNRENPETVDKRKRRQQLVKDPRTGHFALTKGKKFTKADVEKDFPTDSDRDSVIIRRSVGL